MCFMFALLNKIDVKQTWIKVYWGGERKSLAQLQREALFDRIAQDANNNSELSQSDIWI